MMHLALLKTNGGRVSKKRFLIFNEIKICIFKKTPKAVKYKATLHTPALIWWALGLNPFQKSKETEPAVSSAFPSLLFSLHSTFRHMKFIQNQEEFPSRLTYPYGLSKSGETQKFVNINKYKIVSMTVMTNSSLSGETALK